MKYNTLNRLSANYSQNQKADWRERTGAYCRSTPQETLMPYHDNPDRKLLRRDLHVEGIEVYADKDYMYCKGKLSSLVPDTIADVVVAVEWFDHNQNALKTDWKRVDVHPDCDNVESSCGAIKPFIVKTPLDRRVKSVKAYAFTKPY